MNVKRLAFQLFTISASVIVMLRPAAADTFSWTNWQSSTAGTVTGALNLGSTVNVTYTGEIDFTQLNNTGTFYYGPSSTYVGGPATKDMIAISGTTATHTFTFSSPVTNLAMAIVSLGQPGRPVTYNFSDVFTILSQGAGIPFGGCATCLTGSGTSALQGTEGDGIIEFLGTFSTLSFTVTNSEFWNGFTIGAVSTTSTAPVPEPGSALLLGTVGIAVAYLARRQLRSSASPGR
jgi:PEP-CTERM motif